MGSDSSRLSALNIIKANASPDARAGAINGIRGSVNSQVESRIGNNPVMRRMYGGNGVASTQNVPDGTVKVNSHGDKVIFKGGQWQLAQ